MTSQGNGPLPAAEDIHAQLERIFSSVEFNVPDRVRHFLRYVVDETLAGRADRLKAYSIGIEVFDRDQSFDAQNDPVVRIEAGRLRRALERYYLTSGAADPILIDIPKGGYAPTFTLRTCAPAVVNALEVPAAGEAAPTRTAWPALAAGGLVVAALLFAALWFQPWRGPEASVARSEPDSPTVIVAPFVDLGDGPDAKLYTAGLTEEVISQLARFRELTIIGRETSAKVGPFVDAAALRRDIGVRYAVEGAVRVSGDRVRVTARLLDLETSHILWSETYDEDLRSRGLVAVEQDVAQKVATAVAQPYGIIFRADERRVERTPPDDLEAYGCTLRFYAYRAELSPAKHAAVRDCLEKAVARYPDYATAWAMLAYLYLDEDRFGFNPRAGDPTALRRSLLTAQKAVSLDPSNVRALQALMTALFFDHQPTEALRIGEQALSLNPNDTELLGEFGSRVAQSGDWPKGQGFIEQALERNPGYSGFYTGILALAAYMQGDVERAYSLIQKADLPKFPLYHVVAALIYAERGMTAEADAARSQFLQMRPRFFDNLEGELTKRGFSPADRIRIAEGARKAGFAVPMMTGSITAPASISPTKVQ